MCMGGAFGLMGRHEESIRCYDEAIKIDPQCLEVWHNKGTGLMMLRRGEEGSIVLNRSYRATRVLH